VQVVASLSELQIEQETACVAIGAFDGVHLGHQALLGAMAARARAAGRAAIAVTFEPHPAVFFRGLQESFYLSTQADKARRIAALGLDALVVQAFNAAFAATSAASYVDALLTQTRMRELTCGADFALGHNREGNVDYLRRAGERLGFGVHVAEPVVVEGAIVSSTRVRQALRAGAVSEATRLLGRPFELSGVVVAGKQRGRTIGIPTANITVADEIAAPAVGVYAALAALEDGTRLHAVVNIGFRPTFNGAEPRPTCEAHLLAYSGDLYGQVVRLSFVERLRGEHKFAGVDALVAQIRADIGAATAILAAQAGG